MKTANIFELFIGTAHVHIGEVVLTSLKHKLRQPLLEYYIFIVATLVYTNDHIEIIIFIFTINNIYKW
jgi:hypothetical protein